MQGLCAAHYGNIACVLPDLFFFLFLNYCQCNSFAIRVRISLRGQGYFQNSCTQASRIHKEQADETSGEQGPVGTMDEKFKLVFKC